MGWWLVAGGLPAGPGDGPHHQEGVPEGVHTQPGDAGHSSCLDRVTGGGRFGEFGLTIQASRRKALEIAAVEPELWPEVGSSCEEICKDVEGAKEEEEKFNKHEEEKAKKKLKEDIVKLEISWRKILSRRS